MDDSCRIDLLDGRALHLSHRLLLLRDSLAHLTAGARAGRIHRDRCREQVADAERCLGDVREVSEPWGNLR